MTSMFTVIISCPKCIVGNRQLFPDSIPLDIVSVVVPARLQAPAGRWKGVFRRLSLFSWFAFRLQVYTLRKKRLSCIVARTVPCSSRSDRIRYTLSVTQYAACGFQNFSLLHCLCAPCAQSTVFPRIAVFQRICPMLHAVRLILSPLLSARFFVS